MRDTEHGYEWDNPHTAPRRPSYIPIGSDSDQPATVIHYRRRTRTANGRHAAICRPRPRPLAALTRDPDRVTCRRCRLELDRRAEHEQGKAAPVEETGDPERLTVQELLWEGCGCWNADEGDWACDWRACNCPCHDEE